VTRRANRSVGVGDGCLHRAGLRHDGRLNRRALVKQTSRSGCSRFTQQRKLSGHLCIAIENEKCDLDPRYMLFLNFQKTL
jgi:hypothetical protein